MIVSKTTAYDKVKKVILSCKTQQQSFNALGMVDLFQKMYGDYEMSQDLRWIDLERNHLLKQ